MIKKSCLLLGCALVAGSLNAEAIRCDGVLGNSGGDGPGIVHFEDVRMPSNGNASGIAFDEYGALWSFGGAKNLLRLSLDGRMLGEYPLESNWRTPRSLALAGNYLVIQIGEWIYQLPITAPSGAAPSKTPVRVKDISLNAEGGKVGLVTWDLKVCLYDPETQQLEELGTVEEDYRIRSVGVLPGGRVVVSGELVFESGKAPAKLTNPLGGSYQIANGHVYDFAWHMTVSRRSLDFEPEPGVIYGGSSGYVIGSLPEDGEVYLPRGLTHVGGNRYAISGPSGVIHLVYFDAEKQAFVLVRRIGSVHFPSSLVLDQRGRTWFYSGYWEWSDGPASILRGATSFNSRDWDEAQGSTSENGSLMFPFLFRNEPRMMHRYFGEKSKKTSAKVESLPKSPSALVRYQQGKNDCLLVSNRAGEAVTLKINPEGHVRETLASFSLGLNNITSLAAATDGQLLAASDGKIHLLRAEEDGFVSAQHIDAWQSGEQLDRFGGEIYLDADGDNLWVSDTTKNRILLFKIKDAAIELLSEFEQGDLETPLKTPQRIDAAGQRAVVIDWGNQRIVKLAVN